MFLPALKDAERSGLHLKDRDCMLRTPWPWRQRLQQAVEEAAKSL